MNIGEGKLEPGVPEMRQLVELAVERILHNLSTLDVQPAADLSNVREVAELVREPMPEHGQPYEPLLDLVFDRLIVKGYNTASPGTLSYVTGGGLFHSAVADLIAGAINRYVAYWGASPGLAQLEQTVVEWFAAMIGLPATAGGVLLSGGSLANLSALIAARRIKLGDDFGRGTIYTSDQVHHSVEKAVVMAGFPEQALRVLPSDRSFRLQADTVRRAIESDRAQGKRPFLIVANAGTTSTGAIDDLAGLAVVAREHEVWFHVDAAYGGFFALTERGKRLLAGIEHADTVVLDPHKSLFLPFGTGCLLARDAAELRRAHLVHADYIQEAVTVGERGGAMNFGDLSLEMSRDLRGLRVWLPMKLLGAETFRAALDEKLDLARLAYDEIAATPGFEILAEPQLAIFAFRATRPGLTEPELDALNEGILEWVNRRGRVHLSPTRLAGRFALRISVLSFRTHHEHVMTCIAELRSGLLRSASNDPGWSTPHQ
jgi:aromatic-L-amino-acid decarboxylase